jgi:hypothetical protein
LVAFAKECITVDGEYKFVAKKLTVLETEIEEIRVRLAATIDQLAHRANPKVIAGREVTSLKAHFVDTKTGYPRTDNILKIAGGALTVLAVFALIRKVSR